MCPLISPFSVSKTDILVHRFVLLYKKTYKEAPQMTLEKYCEQFNLNFDEAVQYKNAHPELTDEQIILHFRPDLHINIFGELYE
jgi:hypothetical protein